MKKLLALSAALLSLTAMASSYNCKSTDGEFYNFNLSINVQGDSATVRNNATGSVDKCSAVLDGEMQIVQCQKIVIGIANEELDIDGGNAVYQTVDGARGFMKCKE